MRTKLIWCFLLTVCVFNSITSYAQSETHNFITYDTSIAAPYAGIVWRVRISRPANMFVSNNPDTASRPVILTIPGQGEMGTNYASLQVYGPHYWLNHGWDGSVQLGNGIHYPILITVISSNTYMSGMEASDVLDRLLNIYHIKRNSVHVAGLSQGAFALSSSLCYEATAGDNVGMKKITSLVCLEGASSEATAGNPDPNCDLKWARWASVYKGKFFGLEGIVDVRNVWRVSEPMNSAVPGSAYFAYENIGGGGHCCWNSMYDPSKTNWTSLGTLAGNIVTGAHLNTMGTYKAPSNIFQWMLRQGDTTLVGTTTITTTNVSPVASAGNDQTIQLPANSISLSGSGSDADGTVASYQWSKISGGTATFASLTSPTTNITGLTQGSYTFRLTVTDNKGAAASDDVVVTVNAATATVSYTSIPAKIEAESFSAMYGVQTESTQDAGGGQNVGWIDNGDWMDFNVNATSAGTYTLNFRVASPYGAQFQIKNNAGTVLTTVSVPNTGAFQTWKTVSASVNLPQGNQTLRIFATQPSWNINWVDFTLASGSSSTTTATTTKIEAEAYTAMYGVQTAATQDAGGGNYVGWIDNGDWMNYIISPSSEGSYTMNFRVASANTGAKFEVRNSAGTVLATVSVPNTGGYDTWQTVSATLTLPQGTQTLRLISVVSTYWNINWLDYALSSTTSTPPTTPVTTSRIEAESYTSMSGVKTETTQDTGGGQDVGWIDNGDWMDYSVTTSAQGTYTMNLRVASLYWGGQFQIKNSAGTVLATVNVPNTGGFQSWQTVSTSVVLAQGTQTIRVYATVQPWNINWFEITSPLPASLASKNIEATSEVLNNVALSSSSTLDKIMIGVNTPLTGALTLQLRNEKGEMQKQFSLEKNKAQPTQLYLSIKDLPKGTYTLWVEMDNWKTSEIITKL